MAAAFNRWPAPRAAPPDNRAACICRPVASAPEVGGQAGTRSATDLNARTSAPARPPPDAPADPPRQPDVQLTPRIRASCCRCRGWAGAGEAALPWAWAMACAVADGTGGCLGLLTPAGALAGGPRQILCRRRRSCNCDEADARAASRTCAAHPAESEGSTRAWGRRCAGTPHASESWTLPAAALDPRGGATSTAGCPPPRGAAAAPAAKSADAALHAPDQRGARGAGRAAGQLVLAALRCGRGRRQRPPTRVVDERLLPRRCWATGPPGPKAWQRRSTRAAGARSPPPPRRRRRSAQTLAGERAPQRFARRSTWWAPGNGHAISAPAPCWRPCEHAVDPRPRRAAARLVGARAGRRAPLLARLLAARGVRGAEGARRRPGAAALPPPRCSARPTAGAAAGRRSQRRPAHLHRGRLRLRRRHRLRRHHPRPAACWAARAARRAVVPDRACTATA